jgi:hypothetical protein
MRPSDCPKWSACSAPLCPFDPELHKRRHLPGEPVCLWLRELVKQDGRAILGGVLCEALVAAVVTAAPGIANRGTDLRKSLRKASRTGSKLASGRELRQRQERQHGEPAASA